MAARENENPRFEAPRSGHPTGPRPEVVNPSPAPGRFRLLGQDGSELEAADAVFEVKDDALAICPRQQPPLSIDFADVDAFASGEYVFSLVLASGEKVEASMLGRRFDEFAGATAEALTAYQAKHLLLHEPIGGESFECEVAREGLESPCRIRVYATRLAVLPRGAVPYAVAFGEVSAVTFDEDRYAVDLATDHGVVSLLRLGKKTDPCLRLIESRLTALRTRTADALRYLLPQLPTMAARRLAQALPDGVPARQSQVDAIDPSLWLDLSNAAIGDDTLRDCFRTLCALCPEGEAAVGIKETNARQDIEESDQDVEAGEPTERADEGESPMMGRVAWFAFPIFSDDRRKPGNAVAIEAVTRSGRATYLFRIAPPDVYRDATPEDLRQLARDRVRSVSRALVALGFKREPVYLSDEKLRSGPYARYRLALRLSAPLKASRANFVGRAIHGPGWDGQLRAALERARG